MSDRDRKLPVTWSDRENVRWKASLPSAGNSTSVARGDHVFITQADDLVKWPPKAPESVAGDQHHTWDGPPRRASP